MKKLFLLALICVAELNQAYACEICGCGVGNFYLGVVPKFNSKFIGIRYRALNYKSQMRDDPAEFSNDYYQAIELWGGWNVNRRLQLITFIPYQVSKRITDDGEKYKSGLSDIIVFANYNVLNHTSGFANQFLWIGGGLKVPTGQYKIDFEDPENNLGDPNAQPGTGSLDFIVNVNHTISFKKWGFNTSANYKINTTNSDNYKFGNRFTANTLAYYQVALKSLSFAPMIGVAFDQSSGNSYKNEEVELTGGHALFGSTGLEVSYSKVTVGVTMQIPLAQNFADDQTKASVRGLAHVTFTF